MANDDPRKREFYQSLRVTMLEVFDELPKSVRDISNEAQIDIFLLAQAQCNGSTEEYLVRLAKQLSDASLQREREFIANSLVK